jgi:arylsulfatase A-like enzyme
MLDSTRSRLALLAVITFGGALCLLGVRYLGGRPPIRAEEGAGFYIRLPDQGDERLHQTMKVVEPQGRGGVAFDVPADETGIVEVGVVRTDRTESYWGYSGKFRFSVYRSRWYGKETLFEEIRSFALNERFTVRLDESMLGDADRPRTIVCEIEKADKDKAEGYEAYADFKFLVPNRFDRRAENDLNVVLISLDTLRADHLGCYGYERDTSPNIDAFAGRGVRFSDAVSSSPWTTPSHQSIFTGLHPSAHQNAGVFTFKDGRRIQVEPEDIEFFRSQNSLAEVLRENGYYTMAVTAGGFVSSEVGFGNGFNVYREYSAKPGADETGGVADAKAPESERIFDMALKWLEDNSGHKFFMFLHTYECHIPYESAFFVSEGMRSNPNELRKALYDGDIRTADTHFGRFMDRLDSLGMMSNTMVIFLSDHGEEFGDHYTEPDMDPPPSEVAPPESNALDHGHSQYEEMIHVPLIFYVPGLEAPEAVIENQVRLIDVMPTVIDVLNLKYEGPLQGGSLLDLMETGKRDADPPAISEFTEGGPERKAIRKDGYKYIWMRYHDDCMHYCFNDMAQYELFDLRNDPAETNNIFDANGPLADEYHEILKKQVDDSHEINRGLRSGFSFSGRAKGEIDEDVMENLKALGYL